MKYVDVGHPKAPVFRTIDKQVDRTSFFEIVEVQGSGYHTYELTVCPGTEGAKNCHSRFAQARVWLNYKWEPVHYLWRSEVSAPRIPKDGLDPAELEAACQKDRARLLRVSYEVTTGGRWPQEEEKQPGEPEDLAAERAAHADTRGALARDLDIERERHVETQRRLDAAWAELADLRARMRRAGEVPATQLVGGWGLSDPRNAHDVMADVRHILAIPSPETISVELPAAQSWGAWSSDKDESGLRIEFKGADPHHDACGKVLWPAVNDGWRLTLTATRRCGGADKAEERNG